MLDLSFSSPVLKINSKAKKSSVVAPHLQTYLLSQIPTYARFPRHFLREIPISLERKMNALGLELRGVEGGRRI